jgi:soluble lytic murein transglycosylase
MIEYLEFMKSTLARHMFQKVTRPVFLMFLVSVMPLDAADAPLLHGSLLPADDESQPYAAFLQRANRFYSERDFDHALKHLLFARELAPELDRDFRFNFKLGNSYRELHRYDDALMYFSRIVDDPLAGDFPLFYIGDILSRENADSSILTFQALLKRFPSSPFSLESKIRLIDLLMQRNRLAEAEAYYLTARRDASARKYDKIEFDPTLTYQRGKLYEASGHYQLALDAYRVLLRDHRYSEEAYRAKADVERIKARLGSPITIDQFLSGNHVLVMQGHYQQALNELAGVRSVYTASEDQRDLDFQIARIYMSQGLYATAIPRFRQLWSESQHKESLLQLAKSARYYGDIGLSTQAYRDYLKHAVVSSAWRDYITFEIANNYSALGDTASLREANRIFKQVEASAGYRTYYGYTAHFREAFNLYRLGQYEDAIRKFGEVKKVISALDSRCDYWTARSYDGMGQSREARTIYDRLAARRDMDYYGLLSHARLHGTIDDVFYAKPVDDASENGEARLWSWIRDGLERATTLQDAPAWPESYLTKAEPAIRRAILASDLVDIQYAERELEPLKKRYLGSLESSQHFKRFAETIGAFTLAVDINAWLRLKYKTHFSESGEFTRLMYPRYYFPTIDMHARLNRIDGNLLLALVKSESAFRSSAISSARAVGLMQIMPFTGTALAKELQWSDFNMNHLKNPPLSIWMGTYYLRQQSDLYRGYLPAMLGAYNAGPHRANFWMRTFKTDAPDEFPEMVELVETSHYIRKIILDRWIYYQLYQAS